MKRWGSLTPYSVLKRCQRGRLLIDNTNPFFYNYSLARSVPYVGSAPQLSGGLLMGRKEPPRFNPKIFLAKVSNGKTMLTSPKRQIIFSQGDAADAVFYIQKGRIKLSTLSQEGKEAVVAIL